MTHETVPSEAGGPPRIEYELTEKGDQEYFALLRRALADREPSLDVLAAAVGLIEDLPREEALQMLRARARAMDEWRSSITAHLPPDTDLDTWGPVGEVLSLWLSTADYRARWTDRLIRRLEGGAFAMAGEEPHLPEYRVARTDYDPPDSETEIPMANEIMVPLLPCRSIDEIVEFYTMLGLHQTYYQLRPNPCVGLKRDDIQLQFFGMPDFKARGLVRELPGHRARHRGAVQELRRRHAQGPRQAPRFRHPPDDPAPQAQERRRPLRVHASIDPGGNWIRIFAATAAARTSTGTCPGQARRDPAERRRDGRFEGRRRRQAARILDGALDRHGDAASATDLVEALAYRAELALRADDTAAAATAIARARAITLSDAERDNLARRLPAWTTSRPSSSTRR